MAVKTLRSALTLPIELDRGSGVSIATQLEEQLTWLIATRMLGPGARLPSIRRLGAALGVHHHTVRSAYRELQARDLISLRQGATTTVREISTLRTARPRYAGATPAWASSSPASARSTCRSFAGWSVEPPRPMQ